MNKLRVSAVAAALLMAACGTTTISGSQVKSVSHSGTVQVDAGANVADVAAAAEDDLGPTNPTIRKSGPLPVQQSAQPATTGTEPSTAGTDRCSAGMGANTVGSRAGSPGPHLPLPECPVE